MLYDALKVRLSGTEHAWLVTGVAGFIGSHLLEMLLTLNQRVIGLDNFATGHQRNLDEVRSLLQPNQWSRFQFIHGDICDLDTCRAACEGADYVLHQAALGSVPRSIEDPIRSNATNVSGYLNMLVAARDAKVRRFVYAASSSTYGDHPGLPKIEGSIGRPLSPYAVTKYVNELYADVFARAYGMESVGLRYFNVFGPRQDPDGPYAAVIPRWIECLLRGDAVQIHGDGETTRDFCYVANAVQANLLAATAEGSDVANEVYNIAAGDRTSLTQLFEQLRAKLVSRPGGAPIVPPVHLPFRAGDVRHSLADIGKARQRLGYAPTHRVADGLEETVAWHLHQCVETRSARAAFNP